MTIGAGNVVMRRWELWALVVGLVVVGAAAGMPIGAAFTDYVLSGRHLAARTEQDLKRMTEQAARRVRKHPGTN